MTFDQLSLEDKLVLVKNRRSLPKYLLEKLSLDTFVKEIENGDIPDTNLENLDVSYHNIIKEINSLVCHNNIIISHILRNVITYDVTSITKFKDVCKSLSKIVSEDNLPVSSLKILNDVFLYKINQCTELSNAISEINELPQSVDIKRYILALLYVSKNTSSISSVLYVDILKTMSNIFKLTDDEMPIFCVSMMIEHGVTLSSILALYNASTGLKVMNGYGDNQLSNKTLSFLYNNKKSIISVSNTQAIVMSNHNDITITKDMINSLIVMNDYFDYRRNLCELIDFHGEDNLLSFLVSNFDTIHIMIMHKFDNTHVDMRILFKTPNSDNLYVYFTQGDGKIHGIPIIGDMKKEIIISPNPDYEYKFTINELEE